jgi:DNA segregation ATPase FtsK/SpoIIIE-like protein
MTDPFEYDVFLSFSSADEELAKPIWQELCSSGLRVFWSNATLKKEVGNSWFEVIEQSLVSSKHMLLICSENSMNSEWVKREYRAFLSHCYSPGIRRLIPLLTQGFQAKDLPIFLQELQVGKNNDSAFLQEIIHLLGGVNIHKLQEENDHLQKQVITFEKETDALKKELEKVKIGFEKKTRERKELEERLNKLSKENVILREEINERNDIDGLGQHGEVALKKTQEAASSRRQIESLPRRSILLAEQKLRPDERTINYTAGMVERTLAEFGIKATVLGYRVGPRFIQFAVQPAELNTTGNVHDAEIRAKLFFTQINSLKQDLALALSAEWVNIEPSGAERPYLGVDVPYKPTPVIRIRSILDTEAFRKKGKPLAIALGRDVSSKPITANLASLPHLFIAGARGSGKSVCITSIAVSLAMNNSPHDLRLVMLDPKRVELFRFNGLPHLFGKVETDIDRILGVLTWIVDEMKYRYHLLEDVYAWDLDVYNRRVSRKADGAPLPRVVVLIDEIADLITSAPDQTEYNLGILAQRGHIVGIHLIVGTQGYSTNSITNLIKSKFPARLAFAVPSHVDSQLILNTAGAESLLGCGDMLFLNPEERTLVRAQGVMIDDTEIEHLIAYWQKNNETSDDLPPWEKSLSETEKAEDEDLIEKATFLVRQSQRASASYLQRRLRIGFPRAAWLLDRLEKEGVVGPSQGGGKERSVLLGATDKDNSKEKN